MSQQQSHQITCDADTDLLQRCLQDSAITVFTQDDGLRYTWVFNPHRVFLRDDILGCKDTELLPANEAETIESLKRRVLESGTALRQEVRITSDGIPLYYDLACQPVRDLNGVITGIKGTMSDISRYHHADQEHRFQSLMLQNIHDAVIATDLAGSVTYWNTGASEIFGYTRDEMLGRTLDVLYPEQDFAALAGDLADIAKGNDYIGEWQGRRKDGSPIWVDIKTSVMSNDAGDPVGFIGVSKDITRRKELEEERVELLAQGQQANQRLQRFLAAVAHDLGQPVTTIRGYTSLLKRQKSGHLNDRALAKIEAIERAADSIQRLATDLYDASSVSSRGYRIRPIPTDLVTVVSNVVNGFQISDPKHRIYLDPSNEVHGVWDPSRLSQLVANLVSNAIKYSPDGTEVRLTVEDTGDGAILRVIDQGYGIDPDAQARLFEPFTRFGEDEGSPGMGLGLYICKGIVDAHQGRIDVESTPGQGTIFIVTLPKTCAPSH